MYSLVYCNTEHLFCLWAIFLFLVQKLLLLLLKTVIDFPFFKNLFFFFPLFTFPLRIFAMHSDNIFLRLAKELHYALIILRTKGRKGSVVLLEKLF